MMGWSADFRAHAIASPAVHALVGERVAADGVSNLVEDARPCVIYAGDTEPTITLSGPTGTAKTVIAAEVWADTRAEAEAIADALQAACDGIDQYVVRRTTSSDPDLGIECEALSIEWWDD